MGVILDQDDEKAERRKRRSERRARSVMRARLLQEMRDSGASVPEMAGRMDASHTAMWRMALRMGLELGKPHKRRVGTWVPRESMAVLQALAGEANVSVPEIVARIVRVTTEDQGRVARRLLGKLARPVKARQVRPETIGKREAARIAKAKRNQALKQAAAERKARENAAVNLIRMRRRIAA